MILKNKIKNLKKNVFKKKIFLKQEIKKKILKSIIQNKNIVPIKRVFSWYKLSRLKKKFIKTNQTNICLYSGKIRSVFNKFKMSRHFIKKFFNENKLQNNKIINW